MKIRKLKNIFNLLSDHLNKDFSDYEILNASTKLHNIFKNDAIDNKEIDQLCDQFLELKNLQKFLDRQLYEFRKVILNNKELQLNSKLFKIEIKKINRKPFERNEYSFEKMLITKNF